MNRAFRTIFDRLFVVAGAFLFSLFPVFIHQYQQQLIGHVHELQWQIETMQSSASKSGKNIDQYIQKFIDHPDQDFASQGETMRLVLNRWNKFSKALSKLKGASTLTRPFAFARYLQWDIFHSTTRHFQPAFSFTMEGVSYAFLGMICGYFFYFLLLCLWKKCQTREVPWKKKSGKSPLKN